MGEAVGIKFLAIVWLNFGPYAILRILCLKEILPLR
jgi:hypothetical protein